MTALGKSSMIRDNGLGFSPDNPRVMVGRTSEREGTEEDEKVEEYMTRVGG